MVKTGIGYDVHPLEKGSKLTIGGLEIRSEFSSKGHSDGDALTHAIIDALLGAVNRGDIGQYFPSDENKWKGANSLDLLSIVRGEIISGGVQSRWLHISSSTADIASSYHHDCTVITAKRRLQQNGGAKLHWRNNYAKS